MSLELGGSNDIKNLWPEAALPTPGFHEKDAVEDQCERGEFYVENFSGLGDVCHKRENARKIK